MSTLSQVGMLLANTIGSMVLLIVVLRFLLQLVRADFYNPLSQFIVRFTNPALIPLRKIIPGFGGLDVASIVLALMTQYLLLAILVVIATGSISLPWISMIPWAPVALFSLILKIYFWGLLITVIASWLAPNSYNPALILINQILEPAIRPIRKLLPDMGGLDLSPIVVFLSIQVIEIAILGPLVQAVGMPAGLML